MNTADEVSRIRMTIINHINGASPEEIARTIIALEDEIEELEQRLRRGRTARMAVIPAIPVDVDVTAYVETQEAFRMFDPPEGGVWTIEEKPLEGE